VAGDDGAVFLTRLGGGGPLSGATIGLFDADRTTHATGRTDGNGLAVLAAQPYATTTTTVSRDPSHDALRYLDITRDADRLILPLINSFSNPPSQLLDRARLSAARPPQLNSCMPASRSTATSIARGDKLYATVRSCAPATWATVHMPRRRFPCRLRLTGSDTLWVKAGLLSRRSARRRIPR